MNTVSKNDHDIIVYHCLDMNKPLKFLRELLNDDEGDIDFIMFKIKDFLKDYPEVSQPEGKRLY